MKHHTFLPSGKDLTGKVIWRCNGCGSTFWYCGDLLYTLEFEKHRKQVGIHEDCDMEIVKNSITS